MSIDTNRAQIDPIVIAKYLARSRKANVPDPPIVTHRKQTYSASPDPKYFLPKVVRQKHVYASGKRKNSTSAAGVSRNEIAVGLHNLAVPSTSVPELADKNKIAATLRKVGSLADVLAKRTPV